MNALAIADDANPSIYTGVSNNGVWVAVDNFVSTLKTNSLYALMFKVFLKIGSSGAQQSTNLINTASNGTFFGSWVHNATGSKSNGLNTYFKTGVIAETLATSSNNFGFTSTLNTIDAVASQDYAVVVGAYDASNTANNRVQHYVIAPDINKQSFSLGSLYGSSITLNSLGVFTLSRDNSAISTANRNGVQVLSGSSSGTNLSTGELYEAATNIYDILDESNFLAATIGVTAYHKHLTTANSLILFNAIDALESALARKQYT